MIGISGVSLGAILRSQRYDYEEIAKGGLVLGLILAVISFLITLIFNDTIIAIVTEIPILGEGILSILTAFTSTVVTSLLSGLAVGVAMLLAMLIGALVYDLVVVIIKSK